MLDLKLELRDSSGTIITSADKSSLGESISANLTAGTYYVDVASHGSYGDVGQYTLSGTIAALQAAPVANAGAAYSVNEGGAVTLSGAASTGSGLSYAWDLDGDGVCGETGAGATRGNETGVSPTFSAAGLDGPGTYVVSLRVTDSVGQISTTSATITINNVAPAAVISGSASGTQGSSYSLSFSATDPAADTITAWSVNWGDGTTSTITVNGASGSATASATHLYAAGSYTISSTATDEDGTYTTNTLGVNILPPVPSANAGTAYSVSEGGMLSLTGSSSTGTGLSYSWDLDGDGIYGETGAAASRGNETGLTDLLCRRP